MKKISKIFIFILLTSLFALSCKKDNNTEEKNNEFNFENASYSLDRGYIKNFGMNADGSFQLLLILISESIVHEGGENFSGIGDLVHVYLNSVQNSELSEGTYIFSENSTQFTIEEAFAVINGDVVEESGQLIEFGTGSIDVTKEDNQTVLDIDVITQNNKNLSCYFKGLLEQI